MALCPWGCTPAPEAAEHHELQALPAPSSTLPAASLSPSSPAGAARAVPAAASPLTWAEKPLKKEYQMCTSVKAKFL